MHIVTSEGVKPDSEKFRAVTNFPTPIKTKEVRAFLGLAVYYRRFIPSFVGTVKPLTKNEIEFGLDTEQATAFQVI